MFWLILGLLSHEQKMKSVTLLESMFSDRHICDTGDISIESCNNMLYIFTKFWLVLMQDMFFMFCMIYLVCSLGTHIYDKGHIGFNI